MIRNTHSVINSIILIISIFLFQSCIDDDLSNCPTELENEIVQVYFSYSPKTPEGIISQKINPSDINSITLFVFDSKGKFVKSITENNIILSGNYYISATLTPGTYKFVAWGNLNEPYLTTPVIFEQGVTTIEQAVLYLKRPTSGSVNSKIPHLFFGNLNNADVQQSKNQKYIVPLKQNTNNINITVKGLLLKQDTYGYIITDNNSKYNFDNSFAPDSEFQYITNILSDNNNELNGSLRVLRLAESRVAMFEVLNQTSQEVLYKHDLIDLLVRFENQVTNIDWENTHDFEIIISFGSNLEVEIVINGYRVVVEDIQLP